MDDKTKILQLENKIKEMFDRYNILLFTVNQMKKDMVVLERKLNQKIKNAEAKIK